MKSYLPALLLAASFLLSPSVFAGKSDDSHHSHGAELGPHGGRILEFSKNETLHGEVTRTNENFFVRILDKEMKPVALAGHSLVVTAGSRQRPEKPVVEKMGDLFRFPALKGDNYLMIFQFKETPESRAVVARFEYDASICTSCKKAEWLCVCHHHEEPKKPGKNPGK